MTEGGRKREKEREREGEGEKECVCVACEFHCARESVSSLVLNDLQLSLQMYRLISTLTLVYSSP